MSLSKTESAPVQDLNDSGCVQDSSVCENGYKRQAQLLDLSDDVLLYILKHCSPRDLKALGFTCLRLAALVCDHTLWQRVDCRDGSTGQLRLRWLLTHGLCDSTTELKIKGYVDTKSKCLGIQDPCSPFPFDDTAGNPTANMLGTTMVDNVLFRMWYPHLPRCTASPRWPDRSSHTNSENVDNTNTSNLSEPSHKTNEEDSIVTRQVSLVQNHSPSSSSSSNCEPNSPKCEPKRFKHSEPSTSKHVEPTTPKCVEPDSSKCDEPCSTKHCEPSTSKHVEPSSPKCDEPCTTKHCEPSTSKRVEPNSSRYSGPCNMNNGESSILNYENPSSSERGRPTSSRGEVKILSNGEPYASDEADMEPMDVTVTRNSAAGPSGKTSWTTSKPTHNCPGPQFTFSTKLMRDLKYTCTNLTALFIEYCDIDYKATNISHFPRNLKKLSLRGTRCFNQPLHSSYLCKIQDHLPDLEYLDVSGCWWLEPAALMPLSKAARLRELRLRGCARLTECVAYASLAARYGFRALKVLDARESPLADSEVSALGWLPLLEELYVAPPPDDPAPPEHLHSWRDPEPDFHELDQWELEEPDYFKSKVFEVPDSPPRVEPSGTADSQSSGIAEIREHRPLGDAVGDRPWGCYERRIIVIQPNANREMVVQPNCAPIPSFARLNQAPVVEPRRHNLRRPHSTRPHNDQALDLVKRPRLDDGVERQVEGNDRHIEGNDRNIEGNERHIEGNERHIEGNDREIEGNDRLPRQAQCGDQFEANSCPHSHNSGFCDGPSSPAHILMRMGTAGNTRPFYHNHCYDLVTDSAIFRFGRGENEHVVHLGVPPVHESRTRPDRSNLRVLSVTGYRNITDRSLVHLATAAPHLRSVDFTNTNVTARGVDIFKAIRSDCVIQYSKFV